MFRQIREVSGLVASRTQPHVLWLHNDSGDQARVYAIDTTLDWFKSYQLNDVRNFDFEDIALGPGHDPQLDYLYVGDIGDNRAVRESIQIYRIPEPDISYGGDIQQLYVSGVETLELRYPDGAHDAETLLVDPIMGDIYVITKREEKARVFRTGAWTLGDHSGMLEYVTQLDWGWPVGGDVSFDGSMVVVRGYYQLSLWQRDPTQPLWLAFGNRECVLPLQLEPQGEAVCFASYQCGYFTLSEHMMQPLYYYPFVTQ